jgi:hypothetical protein
MEGEYVSLDGIPVMDFSAPAIVALAVLLIFTGRLVPKSIFENKCEEALRWQKAYELEREARSLSDTQTTELMEMTKLNHALITAILETIRGTLRGGINVAHQASPTQIRD